MSGGRFDYNQYVLTQIYETIQKYIDKNGKPLTEEEIKNHWQGKEWFEKYPEDKFHHKYSDETINEFKTAVELLKKAQVYAQRVDWLLSDDDGEETFHERLKDELEKLKTNE